MLPFTSVLRFSRSNLDRTRLLASWSKSLASSNVEHRNGHPRPFPGVRSPVPMHLALRKAFERAAISDFCPTLGCSNLSKLKPCFKLKSAVAACNLPSRLCFLFGLPTLVGSMMTRPLRRAVEPESRQDYMARSSQVAAPPLPASTSLNSWRGRRR